MRDPKQTQAARGGGMAVNGGLLEALFASHHAISNSDGPS